MNQFQLRKLVSCFKLIWLMEKLNLYNYSYMNQV